MVQTTSVQLLPNSKVYFHPNVKDVTDSVEINNGVRKDIRILVCLPKHFGSKYGSKMKR